MGTLTVSDVRPETPPRIPLRQIAEFLDLPATDADPLITGITMDSHMVRPGDLYAALPGAHTHGSQFAAAAAVAGARAILTDSVGEARAIATGLPVLVVDSPRLVIGRLAAHIYGNDESHTLTVGVTGTNGKTTTMYYAEALLKHAGFVTGLSTTPERHVGDQIVGSGLTTPEAPVLQGMIARMRELGATALVIEVSAQAMNRHRIDGTVFDAAGFLNLNPEHMDEYGASMENYYQAKRALFVAGRCRHAVVALEDEWGERLVAELDIPHATLSTAWWRRTREPDWLVSDFHDTPLGSEFVVAGPDERRFVARLGLPGRHMAVNAGMAIALVTAAGVPADAIASALEDDVLVAPYLPGRLERVSGPDAPEVIVDYAHTPVSMADTLIELRRRTPGRLITTFGADGGRDPYKRRGMAEAAARNADEVIICDAHPRTEDPASIRAELLAAARAAGGTSEVIEIADPAEAIRYGVSRLQRGDTFIVLGPGDEDYRAVGEGSIPYSARAEARAALAEAGWSVRLDPRQQKGHVR